MSRPLAVLLVMMSFLAFPSPAHAFKDGLPPLKDSAAFREYRKRPPNDLSKLIYLIDRFKEANIEIVYDGLYFRPGFASNVAKWFLAKQYAGQTPEQWIRQWCDVTIPKGIPIYVKGSDGEFRPSRKVLMDELDSLEKACEKQCWEQASAAPPK